MTYVTSKSGTIYFVNTVETHLKYSLDNFGIQST